MKLTTAGARSTSGGGIEPDRRFDGPVEGFNPTRFGRSLTPRSCSTPTRSSSRAEGDTRIGRAGHDRARSSSKDFVVDDAMVAEFKKLVDRPHVKIDEDGVEEGPSSSSRR